MPESFSREIVIDILQQVVEHIEAARTSFKTVPNVAFFHATHAGKEKLASICMFLMVVGEQIKKIDKLTNGILFSKYPNIDWRRIMTFRNIVAHDYVHIDSEIVFNICSNETETLLNAVNQIIDELKEPR
ncbi:MAG: DUF86 domain-containing protein [Planctomycetaceae bacterium]|nr:DUF86 domain-containing protein [Planctomycetaceae bacterium]